MLIAIMQLQAAGFHQQETATKMFAEGVGGCCSPFYNYCSSGCCFSCEQNWANEDGYYGDLSQVCDVTGDCLCNRDTFEEPNAPYGDCVRLTDTAVGPTSSSTRYWYQYAKCGAYTYREPWVFEDTSGVNELLVRNKCKLKGHGNCRDPCAVPCLDRECVVIDRNEDGDYDDEDDYECRTVLAKADNTDTASEKQDCSCDVASGKFDWCPDQDVGGCCPKEPEDYTCCYNNPVFKKYPPRERISCCNPDQVCKDFMLVKVCSDTDNKCQKENKKLCPANAADDDNSIKSVCCEKDDECTYKTKAGKKIYTCAPKDNCPICDECTDWENSCGGSCEDCEQDQDKEMCKMICDSCDSHPKKCGDTDDKQVCCRDDQECNMVAGFPFCQAKDEPSCPEQRPKMCTGSNPDPQDDGLDIVKICCKSQEECKEHPNGSPYCYDPGTSS